MLTNVERVLTPLDFETYVHVPLVALDTLGPPKHEDDPHDWKEGAPPGPMRFWLLRAPCGLEFSVAQYWWAPDGVDDHAELRAESVDELEHALLHLSFNVNKVWTSDSLGRIGRGFAVDRTDDPGHTFLVGEFRREASARCVHATLERRGHKQFYSVRTLPPWPALPWVVKRRDDNGNEFTVADHRSRWLADAHVAELSEEPRHKQTFWVEQKERR